MLCPNCNHEPNCMIQKLAQVDETIWQMLSELQRCERYNPRQSIGTPTPT